MLIAGSSAAVNGVDSMRILLINYEYPPIGGGAATATQALARSFKQLGHDVTVLTSGIGACIGQTCEDGAQIIRLNILRARNDRASKAEMLRFLWRGVLMLPCVYRDVRPDFAIVFFAIPCGPLGWLLKLRYKVPYIISLRGGDVPGHMPELDRFHAILAPVRRRCLRDAHAVVANSPSLAELARRADGGAVTIIPNGVDTARFSPCADPTPRNIFRFIFVGRLSPEKRLALTLQAFKRLLDQCANRESLHLSVIGDGPLRAELERTAAQLGIAHYVQWLGWLDRELLPEIYRDADCLLHTSSIEGMSNTVLEGMASGLPVISSDAPGNHGIVIDGENGLVFPVDNVDALLRAMVSVTSDSNLLQRLGNASRSRALTHHTWKAAAHAYLNFMTVDPEKRAIA
jgi:glycosyltransferase involved in cell wall biosynthesis